MGSYAVASFGGSPATSAQATVSNTTGTGDAVVVLVGAGASGVINSVTDSQGNTYNLIDSTSAQSIGLYVYQAYTNTPLVSGTDWIKVTYAAITAGQQWIARGVAGVSGFDTTVTTVASGSSATLALTSPSPSQAQEWAMALAATASGPPTGWTGGFTAQQTVQSGGGAYYTFADQITSSTSPLQASATIPSNRWELLVLSMKFLSVFKIGSANSSSGSSLTIPVTTPTQPGAGIAIFAKQQSQTVTSVTDSTNGNIYTVQQSNTGNSYDVTTLTALGRTQLGAAYSTASYSGSGSRLTAAQELDTWLNGGGANWPTHKLSPRTMAFNILREYYNTDPLISASSTGWPTSAATDTRGIATALSDGIGNVCLTFRPARDGTNAYTGSTYTTEKSNLVSAIAYIQSLYPKAKFCLWHEANLFGVNGPFGNGSSDKSLGSPYGSSVTTAQMHANWAAYVGFYGPAFQAAGADLYWVNSMASPGEAVDFFDIALNNTQRGYFTGIASDCYTGNFINSSTHAIKATLTQGYGTNNLSILGLAAKYNLPTSIWELGAGTGQAATDNVTFLDQCITQPLVNWLSEGNAIAEILWFNYGGDVIGSAMDPSVLAAIQSMYDQLQQTTCALQSNDSITVNWSGGTNNKFAVAVALSLATTGLPDQKVTASGSSTAPSATTGTLAQANEVVFAYCSDANASGAITWAGGWTPIATDSISGSTFQSLAYQQVASTSAVTASGTLGVSGLWDLNVITFPVTSVALTSGMTVPKPALAGTGNVATPSGGTTGAGGLTIPKPRLASGGLGSTGTPYVVGSAQGSGTSLTVPVSTSVNSGDSIQVGLVLASTTSTPTVGPDTAGNVYTRATFAGVANDATLVVFQCDGANALVQGVDSIPVTQTTSGTFGALAIGDNGVFSIDKNAGGTATSTAPNSNATATLSQAEEHAIGWIANGQAGGTPTWGSGFTSLNSIDANSAVHLSAAYKIVASTSAVTASGTITSADWACAVITNMVSPPTITLTPSNGIVGVPYSQTLEVAGGEAPMTWSATGLPAGLSLSGDTISGLPATAGTYTPTLTVTDSLGITGTLTFTVAILSGASGAAPMSALSNNLLSPADSDFEVDGWTWGSQQNAVAPFATQAIALTGSWCLGWASLSDGPTGIAAAPYPVVSPGAYIMSGAVLSAQGGAVGLAVTWLDVNSNPIRTDAATPVLVDSGEWTPMTGAFTAPTGAVTAQPSVIVEQSNAGDTNFIDMMFFAQSSAQVLIDWINPPFSGGQAGQSFMDVSPWLRLDGNGISLARGRQDAISEIQPGSASFELQNDQGQFARDSTISLPAVLEGSVTIKCRAQINMPDETGTWWTRFDGDIAEIDYTVDSTGNTSTALVSLTDVLADLNKQDPLFCWTKEQVLSNGPLYHWSLDDAGTFGGAGVAAETSGNNGPPMRLVCSDSSNPVQAAISWQDTSGGVETLADAASATGQDGSSFWTAGSNQPNSPLRGLVSGKVGPFTTPIGSVTLTPKGMSSSPWVTSTQTAQNTFVGNLGYMLTTELPAPLAPTATGTDYSIEMWMMPDVSLSSNLGLDYGPFVALGLGSSLTKTNLLVGIFLNSGTASIKCQTYSQPPAFLGLNWPGAATPTAISSLSQSFTPDGVKSPHHIVVTIQGDPSAARLKFYLDGSQVGSSFTLPTGQTYDTICIGGAYGGCGAFFGNLSLASIYPFRMTQEQITTDCQMGQYGMWEQTTDDCISQLSTYANLPSYWSNISPQHAGLSLTDYMDVTGTNAVSGMQQYEAAEHGLLFVDATGSVTFHMRNWRMGYKAPDLYLPQNTFDADLQYKIVDQFMCNEEGIAGPNTLGATATTLLANNSTGQTQSETTSNTVIQASYVNTESQGKYGVYATDPISSPLSLPLITWSRGYAALGLPSYSYWADPNLNDRAAWDSNSRGEPWAFPASVAVDLLTLDPATGLAISDFYALDIDNVIAASPDSLPPSFPNAQTSVEWFIEGVTETLTFDSHAVEFYTSPAEPQRAWLPGDATYGVLGSTTRLGISAADDATVQAYGKDVAHDAGGPYWPPTFSKQMNAPNTYVSGDVSSIPALKQGFVGAADMRGIAQNLQTMLSPPLCVVQALSQTQSFTNGSLTAPDVFWDTVLIDTAGGMGAVPGWPNWYLVTQAGYYEIDASLTWSSTSSGQAGYTAQGWIIVAQSAAQAIAAGTGNPRTVDQYVCPVGEAVRMNGGGMTPVCAPNNRLYLGVGDMVTIGAEQNYTAAKGTTTTGAGSIMSIRLAGIATNDDRTMINTSIASGGAVSLNSHGPVQQSSFTNTHTYSYQGKDGSSPYARLFVGSYCLQGDNGGKNNGWGSRTSQIAFNVSNIQSVLSGHTILSATLTGSNYSSFYSVGARAIIGWTSDTPGGSKFNAQDNNTTSWVTTEWFNPSATKTFAIPISLVQALKLSGGTALVLGNSTNDSDPSNYGSWVGGPDSWTLTVNYR